MPQIIALDFGTKRTGIAVTDDLQLIASGLTTVNTDQLISFLKKYIEENEVECFVVGEPKRLHGEASEVEKNIQFFLKELNENFPDKKVHLSLIHI